MPRSSISSVGSAEVTRYLLEDRDQIARGMNDVVVRRIFAAGLDLQAALGLLGEHSACLSICHAIDELDLAIVAIRSTIFDRDCALRDPAGDTETRVRPPVAVADPSRNKSLASGCVRRPVEPVP